MKFVSSLFNYALKQILWVLNTILCLGKKVLKRVECVANFINGFLYPVPKEKKDWKVEKLQGLPSTLDRNNTEVEVEQFDEGLYDKGLKAAVFTFVLTNLKQIVEYFKSKKEQVKEPLLVKLLGKLEKKFLKITEMYNIDVIDPNVWFKVLEDVILIVKRLSELYRTKGNGKDEEYNFPKELKKGKDYIVEFTSKTIPKDWTRFTWAFSQTINLKSFHWNDDTTFGEFRLNGTNPYKIKKLTKSFLKPKEEKKLDEFLVANYKQTLKEALEAGYLYFEDYSEMAELQPIQGFYLTGHYAVFIETKEVKLTPVAIVLLDGNSRNLFLPSYKNWFIAKAFANNAYVAYHESIQHLLKTHLFIGAVEVVTMCTYKDKKSALRDLLKPHFFYTSAINHEAFKTLAPITGTGGVFDLIFSMGTKGVYDLSKIVWKNFDPIKEYNMETVFKTNKTEDLRSFFFRDDSKKMFAAIKEYVNRALADHEIDETDVKWYNDLKKEGNVSNLKEISLEDEDVKEKISLMVTITIFTATCAHASVNFSQFRSYASGAFFPTCLRRRSPKPVESNTLAPRPKVLSVDEQKEFTTYLPNEFQNNMNTLVAAILTHFVNYPMLEKDLHHPKGKLSKYFTFQDKIFEKSLIKIADEIETREKQLNGEFVYHYLHPAYVPVSINL